MWFSSLQVKIIFFDNKVFLKYQASQAYHTSYKEVNKSYVKIQPLQQCRGFLKRVESIISIDAYFMDLSFTRTYSKFA